VQVVEEDGDDEIAMLGRVFNQMTRQLKGQRDALLDTNRQIERRRRLFDSVLSSVTSGVIGLDEAGRVTFVNRAAERILREQDLSGRELPLSVAIARIRAAPAEARDRHEGRSRPGGPAHHPRRQGREPPRPHRPPPRRRRPARRLCARLRRRDRPRLGPAHGRLGRCRPPHRPRDQEPAHPDPALGRTHPRKFSARLGDDAAALEQYTEVIVRQTGDLRRIVDEFSKFARMPEPDRKPQDLVPLLRDAVLLQEGAMGDTRLVHRPPRRPNSSRNWTRR
jgi:two-component system, NtrC family, nitrogen regulation sensor histidine kinase NtrY